MDAIRPRHIMFEDMSGTLANAGNQATDTMKVSSKPSHSASTDDVLATIASLAGTIREARGKMQQQLDARARSVDDMLDTTGGRLAVETHVSGQKANWKFQGVKEAFLKELKTLRDVQELLDRDLSAESAMTVKDVKALKVKIRDLNASICQAEQELLSSVHQLARVYDNGAKLAAQTAAQLPHIEAEFREYMAGRLEMPEPTLEGMSEAEVLRLLADEEARAAQLEQQAAQFTASWAAEETQYATIQEGARTLRNEIRDLEEECNAAAKKQGAQHAERLQRFDELAAAVSRLTGVEVVEQGAEALHVTIMQTITRAMPGREHVSGGSSQSAAGTLQDSACSAAAAVAEAGGPGAVIAEHVLVIQFEAPGGAQLRTATLSPPAVDIEEAVQAARTAQAEAGSEAAVGSAVSELVLDVKARIRKHCRRQLQLEDANEAYPLQPTSVSPELLRCMLPNKMEVEMLVPMAWPEEPDVQLELVAMQAPRLSQDSAHLLARLQQELKESYDSTGASEPHASARRRQLQNCGLRELLDWVYGRITVEERAAAAVATIGC